MPFPRVGHTYTLNVNRAVRALIFDFDGLILDTEWPAYQSWSEVYQAHGCEFTTEMWAKVLGGSGAEWDHIAYLEQITGRQLDGKEIRHSRYERKLALIEAEAILPGVLDYILDGISLGLRLAVVSSSDSDWVCPYLEKLGLRDSFDQVICAEDVAKVKPAPDLFLLALNRLGVPPGEAIAFEDSPNGVLAARAAGIPCVAVPNRASRLLPLPEADVVLESLADMRLSQLLRQLDGLSP